MSLTASKLLNDVQLSWEGLEPRFQALQARELTAENLTQYLLDWNDLSCEISQGATVLSLQADLNTADEAIQQRYTHFLTEIRPRIGLAEAALNQKFLAADHSQLPEDAKLLTRRFRTDHEIFREENVPLLAQLAELNQQYSKITGGMLVEFRGEQITAPRVEQLLLEPDRALREEVWRAWQKARLDIAPQLDEVFLKQLRLRREVARNAGFDNFRDYMWQAYHRYDYTPADCLEFHDSIASEVVPFTTEMLESHRQGLGVDSLKPWDFYWRSQMDPEARAPLKPFDTVEELEEKVHQVFTSLSPELGRQFGLFREQGAMDLGSRKNKMSHAYCATLPVNRLPFVLQNVVGMESDVTVTLHEFGHAFHGYASMQHQRFIWNWFSATEFVEVPSQGMECLAIPHLQAFYTPEEIQRVRNAQVMRIGHILPWIAFMDSFQHWLYSEAPEDVTIEMMDQKTRELLAKFQPLPDWTGFEQELGKAWHYYHIFNYPFYYVEYGFSWLGALQLWRNSLQDPETTLQLYLEALKPGDTRTVPELYETAGLKFRFDRQIIGELVQFLRTQL